MATTDSTDQEPVAAPTSHLGFATVFVGFLLFSSSPPLVAGSTLGGLSVAFWRAWLSCAAFAAVAICVKKLEWRLLAVTAVPGLSFGLAISLFFEAAQRTSVANAALIAAMQPLPMIVAARFLFREHVGVPDLGWLALALSGTTFMILNAGNAGSADTTGDVIAIISTVFSAAYFVSSRRARQTIDTLPFMASMMFWAGVAITPIVLISGQTLFTGHGPEWVRLIAIALIPGLGHLLINYSHRTVPLVVIGLMQLLMPVGATTLAWWFLDQSINTGQLIGMGTVVTALAAHTLYRSRMTPVSATAA